MNNSIQDKIIKSSIEKDMLVDAGAGSGKTTVLKKRIAYLLKTKQITPSELLVLTFTNNSAHDMKERIIDEVSNLESDELTKEEIENIKIAINSSHIQTFDSYAKDIVTAYSDRINMPNTFFIADEFVLKAMKIKFIDDIFKSKYEAKDPEFVDFITKFNLRDDKKSKQVLLHLYDKLETISPFHISEFKQALIDRYSSKEWFDICVKKYREVWIEEETKKIYKDENKKNKQKAIDDLEQKVNKQIGDEKQEWIKYSSMGKYVKYLLSLYEELSYKVEEYKINSNTYTFNDIAKRALYILMNFKDIRDEVKNKFKYVMVDEYQDTNDIQEEVINILTSQKSDGKRSHLFTVGDAKQSIYGFRNANLEIFKNRKRNKDVEVVAMAFNYRSFKEVIDDVNTIFDEYMTDNHGDCNYTDPTQRLQLAVNHNDWSEEGYLKAGINKPAEFGLHIITTNNEQNLVGSKASLIKRWECRAIVEDIQNKVNNHYQVWDWNKQEYRDCNYSDFYIIVRTKTNYAIYEDEFAKAGIPLNNEIASNLVDVNPIMFINSLISYFALLENNDNSAQAIEKKKHLFASIARSYTFKSHIIRYGEEEKIYSDQYILDSIKDGSFINDPLFKMLNGFYKDNKDKPFSTFFINMLQDLFITTFLFGLNDVEKHSSKIESLYKFILSIEQSGGNIKSFSDLLQIISKNYLDLDDSTITDVDNAVRLMTIHQSKGLQRQIVYLPNSVNHLGGENNSNKPEYAFDKTYGILLPDYNPEDYRSKDLETYKDGSCIYTIPYKLYNLVYKRKEDEIDEHVRLFYVALTRAVQAIYIVGYPKCEATDESGVYNIKDTNRETLFHMLSYVWGKDTFPYGVKGAFPANKWHKISLSKSSDSIKKPLDIKNVDDTPIEFDLRRKARASQLSILHDEDIVDQLINTGNELHAIMERINFNNPDLSFIKNETYKSIVEKVLDMSLFKTELKGSIFKPEYQYYDSKYHTNGSIDLLAIKDGFYNIIDWKLSNTDKEAYEKQMHIYQRNIQKIFNIDKSKIKLYLISLEKQTMKDVKVE